MMTPRALHFARNREAAHWRAVIIHSMRNLGLTYNEIADWFEISAERARQICKRPAPAAQLQMSLPPIDRSPQPFWNTSETPNAL